MGAGLSFPKDVIDEISQDVKGGHYGLACGKYFNRRHNCTMSFIPSHPNEYFDTSIKLKKGEISPEGEPKQVAHKPVLMYSTIPSQPSQKTKATSEDEFDDSELTMDDIASV